MNATVIAFVTMRLAVCTGAVLCDIKLAGSDWEAGAAPNAVSKPLNADFGDGRLQSVPPGQGASYDRSWSVRHEARILRPLPPPKHVVAPPPRLTVKNFREALVPKGFVLQEPGWHIWCNAPVLDDKGMVHLFVSRWPVKDSFGKGWWTRCEIAHYRADCAEGPYTYVDTVLKGDGRPGSWRMQGTHNVTVVRLPDTRYALLFIANSGGRRGEAGGFPANQKIGLMLADTVDGPWKLAGENGVILDVPADPAVWSHGSVVGVNNPTLLPIADGRFFLYYKAMKPGQGEVRRMGLAIADAVEGPYRFEPEPITRNSGTIEDGFAFRLDGRVNLLVTDCHGDDSGGGMIYQSEDGINFDPQAIRAYEAVDHYLERWPNPAPGWTPWVLQRPALLLDRDGTPTHLFTPCGTPPAGASGTATFLFAIKPK